MPRIGPGLTAAKVRTAKAGRWTDRDGLILFVRAPGVRFWLLRYSFGGRRREAGLGRAGEGVGDVTLAEARVKAAEMRRLVKSGIDPLVARDAEAARRKADAQQAAAAAITFRDVASMYIASHEAAWRNDKHVYQWRATLQSYAFPYFGDLPVGDVTTAHVLAALEPIWIGKTETASRLRGRVENIIDYATARGWRTGENPARWKGHLKNLLAERGKVAKVEHLAALDWREMGAFMAELCRETGSLAALALRLTILTASRTNEVLGARWGEVDLAEGLWTVPAGRMKAGKEHRVPLSPPALDVLLTAAKLRAGTDPADFVFPGQRPGRPLSNMAMAMLMRRLKRGELTVHGFRSSFRDWCSEATNFDRDTCEAALAHTIASKVEAAYRRGDQLEKRRRLMIAWASFCGAPAAVGGDVTPIRAAG